MGFTFDDTDRKGVATPLSEMERLIGSDPRNAERIQPFIGGEEVNSSPTHSPHRYIINFGEMSKEEALEWPELFAILKEKVKPERVKKDADKYPRMVHEWWKYWNARVELQERLNKVETVLAVSAVGQHAAFARLPASSVFSHSLIVVPEATNSAFAALQSRPHELWARFFGSSLEDRLRYTPSDCFETFPFPQDWQTRDDLEAAGRDYHDYRADLMVSNDEGLTTTYNRFHDPHETDPGIERLRALHHAMDVAVLHAYGWDDIKPRSEFLLDYEIDEETWGRRRKPYRYRWPDDLHDEVLARLLNLNKQRAAEEARSG